METFVTFIHVVVALFMVLVVLIQGGNSGGMGAAFGGGSGGGGGAGSLMGATGGQSLLGKLTYGAAAVFMASSIYLTKAQSEQSTDLKERLEQRINEKAGAAGESVKEAEPAAEGTGTPAP